jgi:hypothetical protein
MSTPTHSEAQQNLESLLEQAMTDGEARIRSKDGHVFVIRPESKAASPLDVDGIDLGVTTEEIVQFIQQGRRVFAATT